MKILIVSQYYWPEAFKITDLASNLFSRGHEVTVLTGVPNYPSGTFFPGYGWFHPFREIQQGVRIIRSPLISRGSSKGVRLILNYLSFALFASVIGAIFCQERYDAILVYEPSPITVGFPAIVVRRLTGSPVFFWVQDLWPESLTATGAVRSPFVLNLVRGLVGFIYRHCDRILIQSEGFRAPVQTFGIPSEDILYFPNSAESLYRPAPSDPSSQQARLMPKGFRVLFAGNIGAAQDFATILTAAERLCDNTEIHWIILGDGRMKTWVEEQIRARKLSNTVHLLGRFPAEQMPNFFAEADALLVTLKNEPIFAATIPSKVQSYLACGRPIIAAVMGEGARIVTEAGAGIACSSESPHELAEAVLELSRKSPQERDTLGSNGRKYFEKHFQPEELLTRLENWLANQSVERPLP